MFARAQLLSRPVPCRIYSFDYRNSSIPPSPDTSIRLFGFLLGSTLAGASVYYYILEEYKISNEMLTEDIYVRARLLSSILPNFAL